MRALRSVMEYLRDMNDLGSVSQQKNATSMVNGSEDVVAAARPRRALDRDDASLALSGTTIAASSEFVSHLRSSDVFGRNRSGSGSSWTLSVASTDTSNTVEERKFKDDKGKRAIKVIREIVLYVFNIRSGLLRNSSSTGPNEHTCKAFRISSIFISNLLPFLLTYVSVLE